MIGPVLVIGGCVAVLVWVWRRLRDRKLVNIQARGIKAGHGRNPDGPFWARYPR